MSFEILKPLRPESLRAQLTLWYLLTMGAALCALAVFMYLSRAEALYGELDAELESQAHSLTSEATPALLRLDVPSALAEVPDLAAAPMMVREGSGTELFRGRNFPSLTWPAERRLTEVARLGEERATVEGADGAPVRVLTVRVPRQGTSPVTIQVGRTTAGVRGALRQTALGLAFAVVLTLAFGSYGGSSIARRALAPVDQIVSTVREIQASRLHARVTVQARAGELDRLASTLNTMLDRLEESVRSARRFAADASHELQTPLTTIRGLVESLVDVEAPGGATPRQVDSEVWASLVQEIDRLSRLVRDLRIVALADAGQLVDGAERLNLAGLAADCCEIARAVGEERGVSVATEIRAEPEVLANGLHLRRAILNLTQNAVWYSAAGSTVSVTVGREDAQAVVMVDDHGCGIDETDLPHIFDAFYRADPARARRSGGTGLGLTIARQIVLAHGGDIHVRSTPGVGSTFTIRLPLMPLVDS